jgi:hypothetical protein
MYQWALAPIDTLKDEGTCILVLILSTWPTRNFGSRSFKTLAGLELEYLHRLVIPSSIDATSLFVVSIAAHDKCRKWLVSLD